jgi:hypothetical protein
VLLAHELRGLGQRRACRLEHAVTPGSIGIGQFERGADRGLLLRGAGLLGSDGAPRLPLSTWRAMSYMAARVVASSASARARICLAA